MYKTFFHSVFLFTLVFLAITILKVDKVYGAKPVREPLIPLINNMSDFCKINKGLLKGEGLKYAVRVYESIGKYRMIVWLNPFTGGYMQQHDLSLSPEESKQRNPIRSNGGGGIFGRATKTYFDDSYSPYTDQIVSDALNLTDNVKGTIMNSDGVPLKNLKVEYLENVSGNWVKKYTTFTDEDGYYVIPLFPKGQKAKVKASLEYSPTRSTKDILFKFYNDTEYDSGARETHYVEREFVVS